MRVSYCITYILTEKHANREQEKIIRGFKKEKSFAQLLLEEVSKEYFMLPFSVRMFPFPFNKHQLYSSKMDLMCLHHLVYYISLSVA